VLAQREELRKAWDVRKTQPSTKSTKAQKQHLFLTVRRYRFETAFDFSFAATD
jgi:hypothetical protein